MTYNPHQSKPYVFMQNNSDSVILSTTSRPTQVDDYPMELDVDFAIDLNNGAGNLNSSTYTFTFGSNTFLFGDTLSYNDRSQSNTRHAVSFTDKNNTQVGIRGQESGRLPRNTDSYSSTVMNAAPRSVQRSDEFPRLMGLPNTSYKYQFSVLQQDWSNWSTINFLTPAKTTVVFGFVL